MLEVPDHRGLYL